MRPPTTHGPQAPTSKSGAATDLIASTNKLSSLIKMTKWHAHVVHISVGASKCLGVQRILAQISPNLPEKLFCNFFLQCFSHKDHEDFFLVWSPQQVFICFSANVGRHFWSQITWAPFLPRFSGILPRYLGILPGFSRILPRFSGNFAQIFRDFDRSRNKFELLGVHLHPLPPTPLVVHMAKHINMVGGPGPLSPPQIRHWSYTCYISTRWDNFSIMNNMWSDNISRMLEQNVKPLITFKITDFFCCAFYAKNRAKTSWRKYCLRKSMIGRMCKIAMLEHCFVS